MKTPAILLDREISPTRIVCLKGEIGAEDFGPWMERHARKLGVEIEFGLHSSREIRVLTKGPPEMVDAFALAASLGPRSVNVDTLEILGDRGDEERVAGW